MMGRRPQSSTGAVAGRFWILAAAAAGTAAQTQVVSDGTIARPWCSWHSQCRWDAEVMSQCAARLCQASGFQHSVFVNASNSMCLISFTSRTSHYWIVDGNEYFEGSRDKEAQITALCSSAPFTSTTTTATLEHWTQTSSTQTSSTQTSSTRTSTSTTTDPNATKSTTTAVVVATGTATQTTTPAPTSTSAPFTTSTLTTSTLTTTSATRTTSTITTTEAREITDAVIGRWSMTTTNTDSFCNGITIGSVCKVSMALLGVDLKQVSCAANCEVFPTRRLSGSGRRLQTPGTAIMNYTMVALQAGFLDTAGLARLNAEPMEKLTSSFMTSIAFMASYFTVTVTDAIAYVASAPPSSTTTTSLTSSTSSATPSTTATVTTATATATRTATTTTMTTTVPDFCAGTPVVVNGGDLSHCADIPNGASCEPKCLVGYTMDQAITCENGKFNVPGSCLATAAKTRTTKAIQVTLSLGSLFGSGEEGGGVALTLDWAEKNRGRIIRALMRCLKRRLGQLLVHFVLRKTSRRSNDDGATNVRRLQEEGEELDMRVTILVDDDEPGADDLATLSQKYQDVLVSGGTLETGTSGSDGGATDGGSAAVPAFASSLETELKSEGLPVPAGLSVAAVGPPAVIQQFVVAIAEWLFGTWDPCSSACGAGSSTRQVECSSGEDTSCLLELGEDKPEAEQACEDHAGCPFAITCPLGQDNDLDCGTQAGVAFGSAGVVTVCCLAFCIRRVQLARRPHRGGTVMLPDTSFGKSSGLKASYQIVRPHDLAAKSSTKALSLRGGSMEELQAGASCKSMEEGLEDAGDGKTHIIWDTNAAALKQMFAHRGTQLSFTAKGSERSNSSQGRKPGLPRVASAARLADDEMTPFRSTSAPGEEADEDSEQEFKAVESDGDLEARLNEVAAFVGDLGEADLEEASRPWGEPQRFVGATGRELLPVFQDGDHVEYYSSSLNRWLGARVHVKTNTAGNALRYDAVILATDQRRVDVALDDLRRPLRRGEAVELWSKRKGEWTPVTISATQPVHATNYGYAIDFLEGGVQEKVPAFKLRRRYAVGDDVKAYRGAVVGWASGRVAAVGEIEEGAASPTAESSPTRLASAKMTRRFSSMGTMATQDSAAGACTTISRKASMRTEGTTVAPCARWSLVEVDFEEEGSELVDREWFPTYLVR